MASHQTDTDKCVSLTMSLSHVSEGYSADSAITGCRPMGNNQNGAHKALHGFHRLAVCKLTGGIPCLEKETGEWIIPPLGNAPQWDATQMNTPTLHASTPCGARTIIGTQ